jgi:hypothetical protein
MIEKWEGRRGRGGERGGSTGRGEGEREFRELGPKVIA